MSRQPYPSDVTDAQWAILEPLLPVPDPEGRPLEIERREIVNAIFSVLRSGCPWRYLPHDLPVWETASSYFRDWKRDGTWERIHTALRTHLRVRMGRDPEREPQRSSTANQSRPVPYVGMNEATTGAKRFWGASVNGTVDTQGLLLAVKVHAATILDRHGAPLLLAPLRGCFPRLHLIWADTGSNGKCQQWIKESLGIEVEIVKHPWTGIKGTWAPIGEKVDWDMIMPKGFYILPRRWVVETTQSQYP